VCSTSPYGLPHHLLPIAHTCVDQLLSSDVNRASKSTFETYVGLKTRFKGFNYTYRVTIQYRVVHDYRKLNSLLIKDGYPMRNLFELINEVGQGQIYSIIDLSQGFSTSS
jgi:hypothetical protein